MKTSLITPNPINSEIYDTTDVDELAKSISDHGLLDPLVVTKDGRIISGHRRFAAIQKLGWEDVEVRVVEPDNETIALIEHNRYRQKTKNDILHEARFLEKELKKQIGRGRNAAKSRGGEKKKLDLELAKRLNVGTTQLKQLKSISSYRPDLINEIDSGKISVSAAYKVTRKQFIEKPEPIPRNKFGTDFKKFLSNHQPSLSQIQSTLKSTYPYSLELTGITEFQRDELKDQLKYLQGLDSQELMLIRKQDELDDTRLTKTRVNQVRKLLPTADELEIFWNEVIKHRVKREGPNPLDEIEIISTDDGVEGFNQDLWRTLRISISSTELQVGPGRHMSFFIGFRLKKDFKLLGIMSFHSDSQRLLVRDQYIGWDDVTRAKNREHIVNMNCCVASQPFGFNRLGMKFLCSIVPRVVQKWEQKYETRVAALTTTSLHGQESVYQGMKWWHSIGTTSGSMFIKPLREEWSFWSNWLNQNYESDLDELRGRSSPLQAKLKFLYGCLGFDEKDLSHNHKRGVFMCPQFENWKEFLRDEIKERELKPIKIDWQDWWTKKARSRFEKLKKENRLNNEILFYEEIDGLTDWLEVRGV